MIIFKVLLRYDSPDVVDKDVDTLWEVVYKVMPAVTITIQLYTKMYSGIMTKYGSMSQEDILKSEERSIELVQFQVIQGVIYVGIAIFLDYWINRKLLSKEKKKVKAPERRYSTRGNE